MALEKAVVLLAHSGVSGSKEPSEKSSPASNPSLQAIISILGNNHWRTPISNKPVDLVENVVKFLEASGRTNSGRGSVTQTDGYQRMDASIQKGDTLDFGCVSSLRGFLHPISVARGIMERTPHSNFAHDFAAEFAVDWGIENVPVKPNLNKIANKTGAREEIQPETVGCVCNIDGRTCAGTSTGGRSGCLPGRIGDTPIIGAGTYANEKAAISLTGMGENITKLCCAKRVADLISDQGLDPQTAAEWVVQEYEKKFSTTIGIIVVDARGQWGVTFHGTRMAWAVGVFFLGVSKIEIIHGVAPDEREVQEISIE